VSNRQTVELFKDLARILSPSGSERETADYLIPLLREMGALVVEDDAGVKIGGNSGNIIAIFEGNNRSVPPLMLNAHLDTVEPGGKINPAIVGDRIISLGNTILGADNRAGIVMIIGGMKEVIKNKTSFSRIEIALTVAEEAGLCGASNLDYEKLEAKHGFSLDSSGLGRIGYAAPYYNAIDVTVTGRSSHSAVNPDEGINSILVMKNIMDSIPFGLIDYETTANVGQICGGTARNVVPSNCSASIEIRSHSLESLNFYTKKIQQKALEEIAQRKVFLNGQTIIPKIDVQVRREFNGFSLENDSSVVRCSSSAIQSIKRSPVLSKNMGGSDANVFNEKGIQTVVLGTGQTAVHSTDEYIKTNDLIDGVKLVKELVCAWNEWWSQKIT